MEAAGSIRPVQIALREVRPLPGERARKWDTRGSSAGDHRVETNIRHTLASVGALGLLLRSGGIRRCDAPRLRNGGIMLADSAKTR
jgi:hypothetical protein